MANLVLSRDANTVRSLRVEEPDVPGLHTISATHLEIILRLANGNGMNQQPKSPLQIE
jgi:hypothetical protein